MTAMKTKTYSADAGEKQRILDRLSNIMRNRSDILFAYVHGSITGELPFHDIDVAVYLSDVSKTNATVKALELSQETSSELNIPVDVRALNFASIPFRYQALRGVLLFEKNEDLTAQFVEQTVQRYLDIKPLLLNSMKEAFAT